MFSDGIVSINKPFGISSHDVVNRVRKITGERRVGHAGTLDPLASGVLIVLIGRNATKRQAEYMQGEKEYEAEITFGKTSATDDAQGPFMEAATPTQLEQITENNVLQIIPQFVGMIIQTPPAFSAIKIKGKTAYTRAREGSLTPEMLAPRTVEVDAIDLISFISSAPSLPPTCRIRVHCHKGVYIRSIARDMGAALGVGAYMSALVRTRVGVYTLEEAFTLEGFAQKWDEQQKKQ